MTKKQKIWLGVFIAMFLVPEVLWGAMLNIFGSFLNLGIHSLFNGNKFFYAHPLLAYLLILVEAFSLIAIIFFVNKINFKSLFVKIIISLLLIIPVVCLAIILYVGFIINHMSFP